MKPSASQWTSWQKILFRFFFVFLGIFAFSYVVAPIGFTFGLSYSSLENFFGTISRPLHWLDQHFYHFGFDPAKHDNLPGDGRYGMVFYFTLFLFASITCIVWSWIDRKKDNYSRPFFWFSFYLRYCVAVIMLWYGFMKLIPVQMSYPNAEQLLSTVGEQTHEGILWIFMGLSPRYQMFTGLCEVVASLLLLFRRTYVLGGLLMCGVLTNVFMLNLWYNVQLKIYSSLTLVCVLFVLSPHFNRLIQLFFYKHAISLDEKNYIIQNRASRWVLWALAFSFICVFCSMNLFYNNREYKRSLPMLHQKIYEITSFVAGDTIPPLLTDSLRWKRLVFTSDKDAIIYRMNDAKDYYSCTVDSSKKTFALRNTDDTTISALLHFDSPGKEQLLLSGNWKKREVHISMKENPVDSLTINKEKISLVWDH